MMRKLYSLLVVSALPVGIHLHAQDASVSITENAVIAPAPVLEQKPEVKAPEKFIPTQAQCNLYCQLYGHMIARNSGLLSMGISVSDLDQIVNGMKAAVLQGENLQNLTEEESENMQKYFMQKETEQIENTKKLGETFLKAKQTEPGFLKTASGLCYKIITPGDTSRANEDCTVEIDYEGKLISGKVFDSTYERKEKASLYLGMLIPGFREAVTLIGNGGEIQVFIPSDLAYGDESVGPIPGGSVLEFSIKLHKITFPTLNTKEDIQK